MSFLLAATIAAFVGQAAPAPEHDADRSDHRCAEMQRVWVQGRPGLALEANRPMRRQKEPDEGMRLAALVEALRERKLTLSQSS